MTDALAPYRLSQPLTAEEEALIVVEPLQSYFHRSGITVEHRGPGTYLAFTQVRDRGNIAKVMKIVAQLQLVALKQLGSAGALRMILRLALAVSQDTDKGTLACIFGLAMRLYELEQPAEALPLFRQAWVSYQKVLGEADPKTLSCLNNQANCLADLGRLTEALPLHQQVVALRCNGDPQNRRPETLISLYNQAHCLMKLGRSIEALPLYQTVVASCRHSTTKENDCFLSAILSGFALCLESLGLYDDALPRHQEALAKLLETLPESHRFVLKVQGNLASCLNRQGHSLDALRLHQRVLELRQRNLPSDHPDIPLGLNNIACCLEGLNRLDEALSLHKEALLLREKTLGNCHPLTLASMNNMATVLVSLNRSAEALSILQTLALRIADQPILTKEWPARVLAIARTFYKFLKSGSKFEWSTPLQHLSRAWVQILDLQPPEQITVLRDAFQHFHKIYLQLCLHHHRSDLLVDIIAAIQGRQQAAILLEEQTKALPDVLTDDAPLRDKVLMLRRQLRFAALGLQLLDGGLSHQAMQGSFLRGFASDSEETAARLAPERQRLAEYADFFEKYHKLKQTLIIQEEPDSALLTPLLDIDLPTLQERLAADEALVLLLHCAVENIDTSPQLFTLVIRDNRHRLFEMPEALLDVPVQVDDLGQRSAARMGWRHLMQSAVSTSPVPTAPTTPESIITTLQRDFWATLATDLAEIGIIHLITHGAFHVVPFAAAANPESIVYTYPGLVFYQHCQQSKGATSLPTPTTPLGVQGYPAMDHAHYPPIPLVNAEIQLVEALWSTAAKRLSISTTNDDTSTTLWYVHLASHGDHSSNDPLGAGLLLGPAFILDGRALLKHQLRPHVVFLSACLVGRTSEDPDGEPLGLATALLLQGAHYVIAPLQPVNDCLMPILACLFHQAWQNGLAPPQALVEAKRRLKSGEWYHDTAQYVQNAYRSTLTDYLEALLKEPPASLRRRQGLATLRQWPIPEPYVGYAPQLLFEELKDDLDGFINDFLDHLVAQRAALPAVDDLITWTMCFGGPRKKPPSDKKL